MTIDDIKSLKDKVYELEGLLELAQLREEKIDELSPLIERRLRDLTKGLRSVEEDDKPRYVTLPLFEADATGTMLSKKRKIEETVEKSEPEEIADKVPEMENMVEDGKDDYEESVEVEVDEIDDVSAELPDYSVSSEEEEAETSDISESVSITGRVAEKSYRPHSMAKPAFCINDRFRFRRELFEGSDERFNDAMNKVAMMDDFDEAEEYFIGELGLDPEKEEVVDFLEIIRNYFE